jgi:DNA-binding NtrC family response regulator
MTGDSKIKVLVVDDEPAIRESISQFLLDFDFLVMNAANGEAALMLVRENSFDIAIVDMRLPEMTGDTFILKAHEINTTLKFLILTGSLDYGPSPDLSKIGIGSAQILKKPLFSLFSLVKTIEETLGKISGSNV